MQMSNKFLAFYQFFLNSNLEVPFNGQDLFASMRFSANNFLLIE